LSLKFGGALAQVRAGQTVLQLGEWLNRMPAPCDDLLISIVEITQRARPGTRSPSGFLGRGVGGKPQPPLRIQGENLRFGVLLFYVELDVLGDVMAIGELADDAKGPPVQEPLAAHTESNGSHEMTPFGKSTV